MITQNELYDISFVISLIRNDVENTNNMWILDTLILLINNPANFVENNHIRKALSQLTQLSEEWEFIRHENYYVRTIIFKNEDIHNELALNLANLKSLLQLKKFEQAYDLADALHIMPEMIADNNGKIPRNYYKIFIKPYQKKWRFRE